MTGGPAFCADSLAGPLPVWPQLVPSSAAAVLRPTLQTAEAAGSPTGASPPAAEAGTAPGPGARSSGRRLPALARAPGLKIDLSIWTACGGRGGGRWWLCGNYQAGHQGSRPQAASEQEAGGLGPPARSLVKQTSWTWPCHTAPQHPWCPPRGLPRKSSRKHVALTLFGSQGLLLTPQRPWALDGAGVSQVISGGAGHPTCRTVRDTGARRAAVWLLQRHGQALLCVRLRRGGQRPRGQEEGSLGGDGAGAGTGGPGPGDQSGLVFPKVAGSLVSSGGRSGVRTGRVPIGERGGAEGTEVGHQRKGGRPGGPPVPRALGKESRLHSSPWGQPPCVATGTGNTWAAGGWPTEAKGHADGCCSAEMPQGGAADSHTLETTGGRWTRAPSGWQAAAGVLGLPPTSFLGLGRPRCGSAGGRPRVLRLGSAVCDGRG